jgi:hypothetical protein
LIELEVVRTLDSKQFRNFRLAPAFPAFGYHPQRFLLLNRCEREFRVAPSATFRRVLEHDAADMSRGILARNHCMELIDVMSNS